MSYRVTPQIGLEEIRAHLAACELKACTRLSVARQLGVSGGTLSRRLGSHGVKFSELLEAERKSRCLKLLEQRGRQAYGKILADELGYRELNSFYRAFRGWFGVRFVKTRMAA